MPPYGAPARLPELSSCSAFDFKPQAPHSSFPPCPPLPSDLSLSPRQGVSRCPTRNPRQEADSAVLTSTHVGRRCQPLPGFVLQVSLSSKLTWGCPLGYSVHSACPLSSRLLSLPRMATPASLHQAACFCVLHPPLFWCPQRLIAGRDPGNALWKATCPSTL